MAAAWKTIDGVVLLAVAGSGRRGTDLSGIVYQADYVDRMVYHAHEMESALQRLIGSALVLDDVGRFRVTPAGRSCCEGTPAASVHERLKGILMCLVERVPCTPAEDWKLATEAYETVVARHQERSGFRSHG